MEKRKAVEPWSCENPKCGLDINPRDVYYQTEDGRNICGLCAEEEEEGKESTNSPFKPLPERQG